MELKKAYVTETGNGKKEVTVSDGLPVGILRHHWIHVKQDTVDQYPGLIRLLIQAEWMNVYEREYWADYVPSMTDKARVEFVKILQEHEDEIAKAEVKYMERVSKWRRTFEKKALQ